LSLANKNIILIKKQKDIQNPATIVLSLQEQQEGLNHLRRAVGFGNHKGLTDSTIMVGRGEEAILNSDLRYQ
jgi:hypothetical protein